MSKQSRQGRHRASRRKPLRVTTVIGETFIVAGLAVFGYIAWQPWHTAVVVQSQQNERSAEISRAWANTNVEDPEPYDGDVPVLGEQPNGEVFAILHVPAFGTDYRNPIAEGVEEWLVLNSDERGIGRYPSTQQFGELGNVALAAHRSGAFITPFREVMNLRVGDPLFIQTPEGWYTYRFRSSEYVYPEDTQVLEPFPWAEGALNDKQILTLTTCHPKQIGNLERAIMYSVFDSFTPASDGPPEELVELNPNILEEVSDA